MTVEIYASGMLCCSACAPADMSAEDVEKAVEAQMPCGTEHGWKVSEDEFFSDGETPNGGVVHCHNGETRHWLLDA